MKAKVREYSPITIEEAERVLGATIQEIDAWEDGIEIVTDKGKLWIEMEGEGDRVLLGGVKE